MRLDLGSQLSLIASVRGHLVVGLPAYQHAVLLVVIMGILVATQLHRIELFQLPLVHLERPTHLDSTCHLPDKGDVNTHRSMFASALVAQENADVR